MIRKQNESDLQQIMDIIKNSNQKFDGRLFLQGVMQRPEVYVDVEGQSVRGVSYVTSKILNLHGKRVKVAYVNANLMSSKGLKNLLKMLARTDLITLIKATSLTELEELGFESVIENFEYNVNTDYLPKLSIDGIVLDPSDEKLLECYHSFTSHFTGFFERTADYFQSVRKVLGSSGGIVGFEESGKIVGYAIYETHESSVVIKECCYLKSGHLLSLLSFVSRGKRRLVLHTSNNEHLSRILPHAKKTKQTFLMASVNDKTLFEHLFHIKIISAYSGFNAFRKPLWNRDYF